MSRLRELLSSLWRRRTERDMEEELRFHLDQETRAGIRRGMPVHEAHRAAALRAGHIPSAMEELRDQRGSGWLDGTWADFRHGAASLRRHSGFALLACTALALAVATNTLVFAIVDGVLLKPLPYAAPDRLVRVFDVSPRKPKFPVGLGVYEEYRRHNRSLESIALYTGANLQLWHEERPEQLRAMQVTTDFFPTLGVRPAIGRNFEESEMRGTHRVAILSHTLWAARFHSDPGIVGKSIRLNRENWTVVGVMPRGFQHVGGDYRSPLQGDTVALWAPLRLDIPEGGRWGWHFTNSIARLKAGTTVEQASEDLNRIAADVGRRYPGPRGDFRAGMVPLVEEVAGRSGIVVVLLAAAGLLVLVVACANVAGLCVARVYAHRRETSVRKALGAPAWRLVRMVLAENLLLGVAGAVLGLALAAVAFPALESILPAEFPRAHDIRLTPAGAGFAWITAILTSLLAGLLPALRQTRFDARDGMMEESRLASAGRGATRLRAALVVSEVAFAVVLCAAAVLLLRSWAALDARPHGFDPKGVLTANLNLPGSAYQKPEQIDRFYQELRSRLSSHKGIHAVGVATALPWTGYDENSSFGIVGRPYADPQKAPIARFHAASPGYFPALGVPLIRGRYINDRDHAAGLPVVVINESLARQYFPGEDPMDRKLDIWGAQRRIVGIVADIRDRPADPDTEPAFWMSIAQQRFAQVKIAVKGEGDAITSLSALQTALRGTDPEIPLADVRTMEDIAGAALAERRFALWLFQLFAVLALSLAAFGVYGLLTYMAQQRRRELGIRMALGAGRSRIVWLVIQGGLRLGAAGVLAGVLLAPFVLRPIKALLYGTTPIDVLSLLTSTALLLACSLLAGVVPAWNAVRRGPLSALREE